MNNFLVPVAATALILTATEATFAKPSSESYNTNRCGAIAAHSMHGISDMPQVYTIGHHGRTHYLSGTHAPRAQAASNNAELAASAGSCNTLISAVRGAGLAETGKS